LPPPAASSVYELTDRGRELEPVLDALGAWGAEETPPADASLTATSVLLFLRSCARAHPDPPRDTYRVRLEDRVWTISSSKGQIEIQEKDMATPDATLDADPRTLNALLLDPAGLDSAIASGAVRADGDLVALRRLLEVAA
jgi:hypothetical protein